jgi:hypothetical protein
MATLLINVDNKAHSSEIDKLFLYLLLIGGNTKLAMAAEIEGNVRH